MISALRYEFRRMISIRSTWIVSAFYLFLIFILTYVPLFVGDSPESDGRARQTWEGLYSAPSVIFCMVILSTIAAQSFGHEYRYGVIRLTMSQFPKRETVLLAKTISVLLYAMFMTVVGWSLIGFIGYLAGSDRVATGPGGVTFFGSPAPPLWKVPVAVAAYVLLVFCLTLLTRNLALGIVIPILMAVMIEPIAGALISLAKGKLDWLPKSFPMTNFNSWLEGNTGLPHAGLVSAAWVVGLYALAATVFLRKDA